MAREKRQKKLHLWHPSPWDGVPGARAAVLRFMFNVIGPAALGPRHGNAEERAQPREEVAEPPCPVCGQAMDAHIIRRGGPGKATHMICPKAEG